MKKRPRHGGGQRHHHRFRKQCPGNVKAKEDKRNAEKDNGDGSKTDPRSAISGGDAANEPDGGAVHTSPGSAAGAPGNAEPKQAQTSSEAGQRAGPQTDDDLEARYGGRDDVATSAEVDSNGPLAPGGGSNDPQVQAKRSGLTDQDMDNRWGNKTATSHAAPPQKSPPMYTEDGNSRARGVGLSARDRDNVAASQYHQMLNSDEAQASLPPEQRRYFSKAEAQWVLQRQGQLPSQRDTDAAKIEGYAQQSGVTNAQAREHLAARGELARDQNARIPQPKPITREEEQS
ncbi:hypothetical protein [Deinococcus sp.]|uniref:hypothetical protein n=1 Tax=Deinococcus sp. TaxID=47478 RepID=UPI003B59F7B9